MPKYFTRHGHELYQRAVARQHERLKAVQRTAGEAAGASYDWHDNFAYEDARRNTELESQRLAVMAAALAGAIVFDPPEQDSVIRIGSTALLLETSEVGDERLLEITIGAFGETRPALGLVSYESPLGACLLGKNVDDRAILPVGPSTKSYRVKAIHPPSYRYRDLLYRLADEDSPD
jgi:transcription elongation GreA/GreB family factor